MYARRISSEIGPGSRDPTFDARAVWIGAGSFFWGLGIPGQDSGAGVRPGVWGLIGYGDGPGSVGVVDEGAPGADGAMRSPCRSVDEEDVWSAVLMRSLNSAAAAAVVGPSSEGVFKSGFESTCSVNSFSRLVTSFRSSPPRFTDWLTCQPTVVHQPPAMTATAMAIPAQNDIRWSGSCGARLAACARMSSRFSSDEISRGVS